MVGVESMVIEGRTYYKNVDSYTDTFAYTVVILYDHLVAGLFCTNIFYSVYSSDVHRFKIVRQHLL